MERKISLGGIGRDNRGKDGDTTVAVAAAAASSRSPIAITRTIIQRERHLAPTSQLRERGGYPPFNCVALCQGVLC